MLISGVPSVAEVVVEEGYFGVGQMKKYVPSAELLFELPALLYLLVKLRDQGA